MAHPYWKCGWYPLKGKGKELEGKTGSLDRDKTGNRSVDETEQ